MKPSFGRVLTSLLIVMFVLGLVTYWVREPHWKQADAYLYDWDAETFSALGTDFIRAHAKHRHWENPALVIEALDLDVLYPVKDTRAEGGDTDTRLVVDLLDGAGRCTTYRASGGRLLTMDGLQKHPIDESFRRRFQMFVE